MAGRERVIARSADLAERGPGVRFTLERGGGSVPAFVVRFAGVARAYVNACAHEGVELDWEEGAFFDAAGQRLVCATHGAAYDPAAGTCVGGPCRGGALARVDVIERDGAVVLREDG